MLHHKSFQKSSFESVTKFWAAYSAALSNTEILENIPACQQASSKNLKNGRNFQEKKKQQLLHNLFQTHTSVHLVLVYFAVQFLELFN